MKHYMAVALMFGMAGVAFGQAGSAEPQIAYRILSDYVQQKADDEGLTHAIVGWSFVGCGAVLGAASGAAWYHQDQWETYAGMTQDQANIACLAVGSVGAAFIVAGAVTLCLPNDDIKKQYQVVFKETDPVVQEALAVAAIKDAAETGRNNRITGAIWGFAVPVVTLVVQSMLNVSQNKPWYDGYDTASEWQVPTIVTNITALFTESPEERLYDKYLAAKAAIYPTE